jgi:hypothetical protein
MDPPVQVLRVSRLIDGWRVFIGRACVSEAHRSLSAALREARELSGDADAVIFVEGPTGRVENEIITPHVHA